MSFIDLTDPNDSSIRGGLSTPDPVDWKYVLNGGFINLTLDEFTSSNDVETLFNLQPPPAFKGPYLVWAELDPKSDALLLYLATATGDRTFPFATLDGVRSVIDGSGGTPEGSGALSRSNALPPFINWTLNP